MIHVVLLKFKDDVILYAFFLPEILFVFNIFLSFFEIFLQVVSKRFLSDLLQKIKKRLVGSAARVEFIVFRFC